MPLTPSFPPVGFNEILSTSARYYMYSMMRELVEGLKSEDFLETISDKVIANTRLGMNINHQNFAFGVGLYDARPRVEPVDPVQFVSLYTRHFDATADNMFINGRRSDADPLQELNYYLGDFTNIKKSSYGRLIRYFLQHLLKQSDIYFHKCRERSSLGGTYFECLFFNDTRPTRARIFNLRVDLPVLFRGVLA